MYYVKCNFKFHAFNVYLKIYPTQAQFQVRKKKELFSQASEMFYIV